MSTNSKSGLPLPLARLAENARVTIRRPGIPAPTGKCVVYWMQRAQRGRDNPALDLAVEAGNELGLPVLAYFSVISNFPHANLRHYRFLGEGLPDIEQELAERNVAFLVRRHPDQSLEKFLAEVRAAMLVGDENPCREPERWRRQIARRIRIPYWTVDADVVVPSSLFQKRFFLLHHFRPHLYAQLPAHLAASGEPRAVTSWHRPRSFESWPAERDITAGLAGLDRSVLPVEAFRGGSRAARERLAQFLEHDLPRYPKERNRPEVNCTSRLSPYLHFGHIGPVGIALAVEAALRTRRVGADARDAFFNELIGWRELAVNFVRHVPSYDEWSCAPAWAARTLTTHSHDRRPVLYSLEDLEQAGTHDDLWNAAQTQMVRFGWMHNTMRMYWAKKILEWSPNPATAFDRAVVLNDRYQLDGRDCNSYAAIAWAIVGVHDRPWFERPIFGTVRYMSRESTGRKFDSRRYIELAGEPGRTMLWP
jgi:deoxyribodipyrimidine photo-lyase